MNEHDNNQVGSGKDDVFSLLNKGMAIGANGNDVFYLEKDGLNKGHQIHAYGGKGDDTFYLQTSIPDQFSFVSGHHIFLGVGEDKVIFDRSGNGAGRTTGRIDDFNPFIDKLYIKRSADEIIEIDVFNPPAGVKFVIYNGQMAIVIDDVALYVLDGARLNSSLTDMSLAAHGGEEKHFPTWEGAWLAGIPAQDTVAFNPNNNYRSFEINPAEWNVIEVTGARRDALGNAETHHGTAGRDYVFDYGVQADNLLFLDAGDDLVEAGKGNDTVHGGLGNDTIYGGVDNDILYGEEGDDLIFGGSEYDLIYGGVGDDVLHGDWGSDTIYGGAGDDTIYGGSEAEGDLRDVVFGGAGADLIYGGSGNDDLNGNEGQDTLIGGLGSDTIIGHSEDDIIFGNQGSDWLFGCAGNDMLNGGFGNDRLNGGAGADVFFHDGLAGHGSDWIQDYSAAEGDVLKFGLIEVTPDTLQVNFAHTPGAGRGDVAEAFVIYKPSGEILWALVDGAAQDSIWMMHNNGLVDLLL